MEELGADDAEATRRREATLVVERDHAACDGRDLVVVQAPQRDATALDRLAVVVHDLTGDTARGHVLVARAQTVRTAVGALARGGRDRGRLAPRERACPRPRQRDRDQCDRSQREHAAHRVSLALA
ncbi:MAG: hypothetical protein U0168_22660 [Nannocystaceae bacterium]